MRRPRLLPHWLAPTALCLAAAAGMVALHLHFTEEITEVGASGQPAWAVRADAEQDLPPLRSEAVGLAAPADSEPTTAPAAGGSDEAEAAAAGGDDTDADADAEEAGTTRFVADESVWVDPASSGRPWSALGAIDGLLTFRGNPTRSFYGRGPVPRSPEVAWSLVLGCSVSPVGDEDKVWCGSGWTGQPAVFPAPAGDAWWLAFGAYNRSVSFLDPGSGDTVLLPYATGDIIKGSITVDPDGFPLVYTGSRDNYFHVVAIDRERPAALWKLWSEEVQPTMWNNDWDGSALVIDDYLFVGGENSRFYVVRLNRGYGPDGLVTVDPEIVFTTEAWDDQLLRDIGDRQVSVESSVAIADDVVYFANSGGLVQGWDIGGLDRGIAPEQVFRFWTGDDTDATLVIDNEGMLYAVSEYERGTARSTEVGQIMKLDPSRPNDPLVWGRDARAGLDSGVWATPAIHGSALIVPTNEGELIGFDRASGDDLWRIPLAGPLWSSPVVVDDVLIQGDCEGVLHAFDVSDPTRQPVPFWRVRLEGCIESTPAVWDGRIFVGTRSGSFYAIADTSASDTAPG